MFKYAIKAFNFLWIIYPNRKFKNFLYYIPCFVSILITFLFFLVNYLSNKTINIFTEDAFNSLGTFIQVLPGFYIGSLAAIASYGYVALDKMMESPTPYIKEETTTGSRKSPLTRRRYLTIMFGYLVSMSIVLTIFVFLVQLLYSVGVIAVAVNLYLAIYYLIVFFFFLALTQMLLITFFGVYYLSDRMHR